MNTILRNFQLALLSMLICQSLLAHNGKIGYAYPLGNITVDGDLSDWPGNAIKYYIGTQISDTKAKNSSDFSGYFQVGYRLEDHSLYVAFTITDDSFVEDTSANVRWNTQDGLELGIDARHLKSVSGVASFMFSKKLRNINKAYYDPFATTASWDMATAVMLRNGSQRTYEWRIQLGDQLQVGKSIGLDFLALDLDTDSSFTFAGWGKGGSKYRNPNSLGDIILMPANVQPGTVTGRIEPGSGVKVKLPQYVRLNSIKNGMLWVQAELDSLGNYTAEIPAGKYQLSLPNEYFFNGEKLYHARTAHAITVGTKAGQKNTAKTFVVPIAEAPDLIPEKGLLLNFQPVDAARVDQFIETYQKYYNIPGVSLALIKDGKVVYHKTYGLRNTMTQQAVDGNTLFEAASITKPVFAHAVERLADRGVIDLDKPLYEYLPYKDIEYDDRYKLMTARHVLTHRTGFPNWRSMNPDGKLNLRFTPGTAYNYSGEGFEYLKIVVEKITGKKVEQVLQEEVIQPMGLYHTFFSRNDSLKRMVADGHYDGMPNYDELNEIPGMAWSMRTEAKTFTNFMLYLLEEKGLSKKMYETVLSKHSDYNFDPDDEKPPYPVYMGMSLEIRETPFGKSFGHGGNNGDFKCTFVVYKDLKMGFVVFTNSNTSDILLQSMRQFFVEGKEKQAKP
jgi:CubicO group peptidase (beta-lactamase class C family)